jgi:hypothetical protein
MVVGDSRAIVERLLGALVIETLDLRQFGTSGR